MLGSVSGSIYQYIIYIYQYINIKHYQSILAARVLISAKNLKECNKERRLMEDLQKSYWNVQVNFSRKQK